MVKPNWDETRMQLIETYKTLNTRVRPKGEEVLDARHGSESVSSVVREMKDHELLFSKALTLGLSGEILGDNDDEPPVIGNEVENETGVILISQFGSARATTLNTMMGADDEAWDRPFDGNKTLIELANDLVESDRVHMEKINRMIGS